VVRRFAPLLLLAALIAGCGSDSGGLDYGLRTPPPYVGGVSVAPKGQVAVDRKMSKTDADHYKGIIASWANAVRHGDADTAARYFDLPAVIYQPGHTALQVNTPQIAAAFNASLPCGAKLIGTNPDGRYVVGTFVLVNVGRLKCDTAGDVARVGFVFGDKRHPRQFTEWWQVADSSKTTGPAKRPAALTPATVSDFS
jgi:hypothetical protein